MSIKTLETLLLDNNQLGIPEFSVQTGILNCPFSLENQEGEQKRLRKEYELLPRRLRELNERYSQLVAAVELGYLSKKLVAYVWEKVLTESARIVRPTEIHFTGVQKTTFDPKKKIFGQGEKADKLYFIENGEVDIVLEERPGNKNLATLPAGSIFGEMAVIDDSRRSASAYAKGVVTVSEISKEELLKAAHEPEDLERSVALLSFVVDTIEKRTSIVKSVNDEIVQIISRIKSGERIEEVERTYHLDEDNLAVIPRSVNTLTQIIHDAQQIYWRAVQLREKGELTKSIEAFESINTYHEIKNMCEYLDYTAEDYAKLSDHILEKGLLAGMLRFGHWNSEHVYRNRRFLFEVIEKSSADKKKWAKFGDLILSQHPGWKITLIDCELALEAYQRAGSKDKIETLKAYAKEKRIPISCGTDTKQEFIDLNTYQRTPGISNLVQEVTERIFAQTINTKHGRLALNFQRACALEPLSDKKGCTTRYEDLSSEQKLEQFVVAGVNLGGALLSFLTKIEQKGPDTLYDSCYDLQVMSKLNRRGGRINQGIIEFGFPLLAAIALYDPNCEREADYICDMSVELMKSTKREDVDKLREMKQFAYLLSRFEREVPDHNVDNVYLYYQKELCKAEEEKNLNSIVHNYQFLHGFPDIKRVYQGINQRKGNLNDKAVAAYNEVFNQQHYQEVGKGLAADFIAVALFLTFCYHKEEEIVW